ncbi:phage nozzle protein [Roseixanthobacter pseudopolyaromaticivorans]|uniref:phage nozzle protein n=1 Tax=Xanthobacteraceae TaxID=335928 RepID=UPI00372C7364
MSHVSGDIANLYSGVSQQAVALRLPTQCESQENFYSTIVGGLKKRPPMEVVAKLPVFSTNLSMHMIDRDADERYVTTISRSGIRVFDFAGNERFVDAPNGWGYLADATDEAADFKALTVADYTFIVNRKKVVQRSASFSPTRPHEALIYVVQGNYSRTYNVTINGNLVGSYKTPGAGLATSAVAAGTDWIANILISGLPLPGGSFYVGPSGNENQVIWGFSEDNYQIVDNHGLVVRIMNHQGITPQNGWTLQRYQSTIYVNRWDGQDFSLSVDDGYNGNAMKVSKGSVQKFTDLPAFAPKDFVVQISGTDTSTSDNYWVKATKDGGDDANSQVIWKESVAPGTCLGLDPSTMPHILVREADGHFTFKPASWDERECGDGVDINPDPSFVGRTLEDIFFHRNRLGFLSDENVVMSRSGSFFNFFRTTATALLDDDPIDVAASHVKVSILRHAVPTQDYLVLLSADTQFRLAGNDLLTPKSVSLRPLTEYSCSTRVAPAVCGKSVFFVSDAVVNKDWAVVYDYLVDKNTETAEADNVTSHVPNYIPSGVRQIVGSSDEETLAVTTDGDPGAIYIYRYYWSGDQKLQSSWSRWSTPSAARVVSMAFLNSDLYVVTQRVDGIYLERMRMQPAAFDEPPEFMVHLDRRIVLSGGAYDAFNDRTTYQLPYPVTDTLEAVAVSGQRAEQLEVIARNGYALTVKGNSVNVKVFCGVLYESRYRFSTMYHRQQSANGGMVTMIGGRLQLLHLSLTHDQTGYFRVEVTVDGRSTKSYPYFGRVFGDTKHVFNRVELESARISTPIMSRSDRVVIELVNDSWLPSSFVSARWRGTYNATALQI